MTESLIGGTQPPQIDPTKDYTQDLVGEDKKYKDLAALARSRLEADAHIARIEAENRELRQQRLRDEQYEQGRARMEELLQQFDQRQNQQSSNANTQVNDIANQKPQFDPNEVKSLINTEFQNLRTAERQSENFRSVQNKLNERYGDRASDVLSQQIQQLGVSVEYANDLAKNHPRAFERMFGLDMPVNSNYENPLLSTNSIGNKPKEKKTWSYYQKMRKENPKLYKDPKTQQEMAQSAAELGREFEDGDYAKWAY